MNESTEQNPAHSEFLERLRENFSDEEYRNAYAESFLNSYVAGQIKVLREEYPMTQSELAEKIGTKQPGVARLENVNYSAWKVETLRRVARALKVRLKITFEEWATLPQDVEGFRRERLIRAPFDRDRVFSPGTDAQQSPSELGSIVDVGFPPRPMLGSVNAWSMQSLAEQAR